MARGVGLTNIKLCDIRDLRAKRVAIARPNDTGLSGSTMTTPEFLILRTI